MTKYSTGKNPTDTKTDQKPSKTYESVPDDDELQTAVETALTESQGESLVLQRAGGEAYTPSTLEVPLENLSDDPVINAVESTDAVARAYSAFITNPESRIGDTTLSDYTPRFHIAILTEHAAGHPDNN